MVLIIEHLAEQNKFDKSTIRFEIGNSINYEKVYVPKKNKAPECLRFQPNIVATGGFEDS